MDPACRLSVALLIDRPHVRKEYEDSNKLHAVSDKHPVHILATKGDFNPNTMYSRDISGFIPRLLAVLESLRSDDVAYAVSGEQSSTSELFLGVTGDVARDDGQAHAEPKALEVAHPQRDEAAPFVVAWKSDEQARADDADDVGHGHGKAAGVGPVCADVATRKERDELYCASWNLQVLSPECVYSERFDDHGAELDDVSIPLCYVYLDVLLLTVVNAEFGIWAPVAMTNRIQVLGSYRVCQAW